MPSSGMNLITTVIGFGMSATFIVFVCTRIICGRLRSSHSNSPNYEIESRVDLEQQPESRVSGLEPVLIAAIPTMKFDLEAFSSVEDAQLPLQDTFRTKPVIPMTVSRDQSFDGSEISTDHHSQHWLQLGNTSSQEQLESVPECSSFKLGNVSASRMKLGNKVQRPQSLNIRIETIRRRTKPIITMHSSFLRHSSRRW